MVLHKEEKRKIIEDFQQNLSDTGSVEVQIALLTNDIRLLTGHCQAYPKDFSSKRGLLKMVCRRRRFLRYLGEVDENKYRDLVKRLGLRK